MKLSYTVAEAAGLLNVTPRTIYRQIETGEIETVVKRGRLRVELQADLARGDLLRPPEVADLLQVSRSTVYRWIEEGRLSAVRLGKGTVRVTRESLERLMAAGDID